MSESDYGIPNSCELCRPAYILATYEVWTEITESDQLIEISEDGPLCTRQLLCDGCTADRRLHEITDGLPVVMIRSWDPLGWL